MEAASTQSLVLEVLKQASCQDPIILKQAEAKLQEWEIQPGFYTALYNVLINHNLDVNVRLMAVVCIKNGVEKYWRKNAPNAMAEEERQGLKEALTMNFHEPVNQIAVHIAVLISKIARWDCPKEWPTLLPTLLQAIGSSEMLIQHRSLLTLHHVVKVMSSKRLLGDRHAFLEFTAAVYPFILNMWNTFTETFINEVMQNATAEQINASLEKALLTLRILRKLTVYGFYKPNDNADCMNFMKAVFDRARTSLECRRSLKSIALIEHCEKFIVHLTKNLLSVIDAHPFAFIDFIKPSLEFVYYYLFASNIEALLFERFIIQCFNLMKVILVCPEYRVKKGVKDAESSRADGIIREFFQPDILSVVCKKLISHYFILTQEDLELWDADPEAFVIDESGETWKYSLRPSMECLYLSLFPRFCDNVSSVVLELVRETNVLVPPEDMQGVLRKDAVYNAVGLAKYNMYEGVDFDQWFMNVLTQELKIKHNNYRILRRRVVWLMGQWSRIKLACELRPALYECCLSLLDEQEDIAVRLTASTAFRSVVDDPDFNPDQFQPYVEPTFIRLLDLLKASNECETKMQVLNVITLMLERCGQTIVPNSVVLLQYLPVLWHESEEHNMLRCAIVATFIQLVRLGCNNSEINAFLVLVIQLGVDTNQSAILYLLEDCLELWVTMLQTSKELNLGCMELFSSILPLIESSTENWVICMQIIRVYLLLNPDFVIVNHGVQLIRTLDGLMSDLRFEALIVLARLFETMLCISPTKASEIIKIVMPRIMEVVIRKEEPSGLIAIYLSVISRVILASHDVFSQSLLELARISNNNEQDIIGTLLDIWTDSMPNVSNMENMKLLGLALTNMLTIQSQPIIQRIPRMLINISETLNDIMQTDDTGLYVDSLVMPDPGKGSDEYCFIETEHDIRESQLLSVDLVHTVVLKDYLQSQLHLLKSQLGQQYEQLIQAVDHNTISQLSEFVTF